jgi:tetratricopeptide (TPR) repeat protein
VASFESITPLEYLASQIRVVVTYQRLLLVPVALTFFREAPLFTSFADWRVMLPFGLHLLLLSVAMQLFRCARRDRSSRGFWSCMISFGIVWFYLALAMESSIIPMDNLALEQRMYLPAFGGLAALTAMVMLFFSRGREGGRLFPSAVLLGTVICVFAVLTFLRNEQWRDPLVFWQDNLRKSPGKLRIHAFIGNIYHDRGDIPQSLREYKQAFAGNHRYWQDHFTLGNMFFENGLYQDAVDEYLAALKLHPDGYEIYAHLSDAYRMIGDLKNSGLARQKADQAERLMKDLPLAH